MLQPGWHSETKWRLYMGHLGDVAQAYHTLPRNQIDSFFASDGPRGDLHFLHETVRALFETQESKQQ